ncbi:MAG TPA: hypothetical protein VFM88_06815 [Vicinamibacteria bacterium]|nr:hypothetical protein [Vicinamibacteria bacterium]
MSEAAPRDRAQARLGLLLCLGLVAAAAHFSGPPRFLPRLRELQSGAALRAWLFEAGLRGLGEAVAFGALGFLAVRALAPGGSSRSAPLALALTTIVPIGLLWSQRGALSALDCLPGLVGGLLGFGLGVRPRAVLWLLGTAGALAVASLAIGLSMGLEGAPLAIETSPLVSSEKRDLYRRLTARSPRSLGPHETHAVRLTEHDLNVLLAWAISMESGVRRGRVQLGADGMLVEVSVRLPLLEERPYLNVRARGRVAATDRDLSVDVALLRIGRLQVPQFLLKPVAWTAVLALQLDSRVRAARQAIRKVESGGEGVEVAYGHADLGDLTGSAERDELTDSVRAQAALFTQGGEPWPPGDERTARAVEAAFRLARERSQEGSAMRENEAAIIVLGTFLGHRRIENLYGTFLEEGAGERAESRLQGATLRGRNDWTRHFFVSAALTVLATRGVSDASGLFKEELDADGGSGFSFADLLANRSGTTFAQKATASEDTARRLQEHVARGFRVGDLFPAAEDLPEGISDEVLGRRYGGVGGPLYRKLAEEIERRVAACAAYRAS